MKFMWDKGNTDHIARHYVSPEEAEYAFSHEPIDLESQEDDADTYRYVQIGETAGGRIIVILSTVRHEQVRIISAWDAPKAYKNFYLEEKARLL